MPILPRNQPLKDQQEEDRIREELRQARTTIENYDRELRRRTNELRQANQHISDLQHERQRSKDFVSDLQNLINVHQKLDPKTLSDVSGPQVSIKADTLSISEVGEKVTALNEEIFQAAAALGEALIHKRHKVSQNELDAFAAESQKMVGEKMTNILLAQAQKSESEVNPLLVQVVLQIFMVKFCVSKIQSWYPGDGAIGGFLSAIYYEIRSTGKHRIDSITKSCPTFNTF
jgi:hypothetical protein